MTQQESRPFNIFVPNLLNICIDSNDNEELSGRMYHCYSAEPVRFENVIELIQAAERFFDTISFPQASTKTRYFTEVERETIYNRKRPPMVVNQRELIEHIGKKGTFLTSVRFRQNSSWQGEFKSPGTEEVESFKDVVEFVKKIEQKIK